MVLMVTITILCIYYILVDLVPIYQSKQRLLFWIYSTIMVLVYVVSVLIAFDVKVPSPALPLKKMVFSIWGHS